MAKGKVGRHTKYSKALLKKAGLFAKEGCNNEEIALNIGIAVSTLYEYMLMYTELSEVIKAGRDASMPKIENGIYKLALGGIQTTETITERGKDGNITSTKTVVKESLPSITALKYYAGNRGHGEWTEKQDIDLKLPEAKTLIVEFVDPKKDGKE